MIESSHLNKEKLTKILKNSYSPYSKFAVASMLVTEQGECFYGCNVENSSYGATICAERSALSNLVTVLGPQFQIKEIHVLSRESEPITPCGICRQCLFEFSSPKTKVFCHSYDFSKTDVHFLDELLPKGFKL